MFDTFSTNCWTTHDGLAINARCWSVEEPTGWVLLVHGLGDHSGRFEHVARRLNRAGFSVMAPDLRGHGQSGGQRGFVSSFDVFLDDLQVAIERIQEESAGLPVAIYAQSFGALVALNLAIRRELWCQAMILSSPALRVAMPTPRWKITCGRSLGWLLPRLSLNTGLDISQLCDDQEVIEKLRRDPLRHQKITPATYFGMVDAGRWCLQHPTTLAVPTLIMHGARDRITDHLASQQFAGQRPEVCELKIWPEGQHELHNMKNHSQVLSWATDWLRARLGLVNPSGSAD